MADPLRLSLILVTSVLRLTKLNLCLSFNLELNLCLCLACRIRIEYQEIGNTEREGGGLMERGVNGGKQKMREIKNMVTCEK